MAALRSLRQARGGTGRCTSSPNGGSTVPPEGSGAPRGSTVPNSRRQGEALVSTPRHQKEACNWLRRQSSATRCRTAAGLFRERGQSKGAAARAPGGVAPIATWPRQLGPAAAVRPSTSCEQRATLERACCSTPSVSCRGMNVPHPNVKIVCDAWNGSCKHCGLP